MIELDGFEVSAENTKAVQRALAQFPELAFDELGGVISESLVAIQGEMQVYPDAPPDSRYERTGTLGRLWTSGAPRMLRVGTRFVEGKVGNATPYGPYVQGTDDQSEVHRANGWRTVQDVVDGAMSTVQALLSAAGDRLVARVAQAAG